MSDIGFKKACKAAVRARMPKKRKVNECAELLGRLSEKGAVEPKTAVSTADLSKGIPGARGHLKDMVEVGLVKMKSNEPLRFFLDARDPDNIAFPKGPAQIQAVREANISELLRHIGDSAEVARVALAKASAPDATTFREMVKGNDNLFSAVVDEITKAGLRDKNYKYGAMGWRTGCFYWYLGDDAPKAS